MGPVVEKVDGISSSSPFLTRDPYEILSTGDYWSKGKVDMILSLNSDEGLLHSVDIVHHPTLHRTLNMEWVRAVPITLMLRDTAAVDSSLNDISFAIKSHYFGELEFVDEEDVEEETIQSADGTVTKKIRSSKAPSSRRKWKFIGEKFYKFEELTKMYGDRYFNVPTHHTALLHSSGGKSNVFLVWFDYPGKQSTSQFTGYNDTIFGN
jgi:hypothetical protein